MTTTVEFIADPDRLGPAILVHHSDGAYHPQGNPGVLAAVYSAQDGVRDDLTAADVAAVVGIASDALHLVGEEDEDRWEVGDPDS